MKLTVITFTVLLLFILTNFKSEYAYAQKENNYEVLTRAADDPAGLAGFEEIQNKPSIVKVIILPDDMYTWRRDIIEESKKVLSDDRSEKYNYALITTAIMIAETMNYCKVNNKQMAFLIQHFIDRKFNIHDILSKCSDFELFKKMYRSK